jgi:hypothetical protein
LSRVTSAEAKTFLRNELNSAAGAATGRSQFGTSEVDELMFFLQYLVDLCSLVLGYF